MPSRKTTKAAAAAATDLPSIPKELIDQFVKGPMSAEAVQAASMAFKKALIEEDHRVHRLQRARLPGPDLGHHRVGDRADELRADLGAVLLGEETLDLAHGHAARVHSHDLVVEAGEASLVLGDQDRLERALPVARHLDTQRPVLVQHGLAAGAVAMALGGSSFVLGAADSSRASRENILAFCRVNLAKSPCGLASADLRDLVVDNTHQSCA